jgi:hypothetical protein
VIGWAGTAASNARGAAARTGVRPGCGQSAESLRNSSLDWAIRVKTNPAGSPRPARAALLAPLSDPRRAATGDRTAGHAFPFIWLAATADEDCARGPLSRCAENRDAA